MGKRIVRISEQALADLITKMILGGENNMLSSLLGLDKTDTDSTTGTTSGATGVVEGGLDLNTPEGYKAYADIAQKFISSRKSNLLNITGTMLADAAKKTFNQNKVYVPVELALAQLALEGGFVSNPNARPIKTNNPFNVGNVDSGKNIYHGDVKSGIDAYYSLMGRKYLTQGKTMDDLLKNFVNNAGLRYAGSGYESKLKDIVKSVGNMAQPVYASLSKMIGSNMS